MPEMDLRQIDAAVAEHIMGLTVRWVPIGERQEPFYGDTNPRYSSDIAAAWQVVEELRARGIYIDINTAADFYQAVVFNHEGDDIAGCAHPSAPFAICLAALRAVGVEVPEDA